MAELGTKHECYSCGAKFYDFGRPAPICPQCGANQKDVKRPDTAAEGILRVLEHQLTTVAE